MSRNFDSLKGLETQPLANLDGNINLRVTPSCAALLADELAQIERIVGHSIGKLKAVVEEGAAAERTEKEASEQAIADLTADVATLTGQLRNAEQSLQSRSHEVNDLSIKLQMLTHQVMQLGQVLQQAKTDAASEVARATAEVENARAKIVALEAKVDEAESIIRVKDSAIAEVEQVSSTRIAQMESQLRDKEMLIAAGYRQIGALKSEVSRLKDGVLEMASFVTMHAKSITDSAATDRPTDAAADPVNPGPLQRIYSQDSDLPTADLFDR